MAQIPHSGLDCSTSSAEEDLYALLGLTPEADAATIRQAWRRLAAIHHPDVTQFAKIARNDAGAGSDTRTSTPAESDVPIPGAEKFLRIQHAYFVLSHPGRKRDYDQARPAREDEGTVRLLPMAAVTRGSRSFLRGRTERVRSTLVRALLPCQAMLRVRFLALAVMAGAVLVVWELDMAARRAPHVPATAGGAQDPIDSTAAPLPMELLPGAGAASNSVRTSASLQRGQGTTSAWFPIDDTQTRPKLAPAKLPVAQGGEDCRAASFHSVGPCEAQTDTSGYARQRETTAAHSFTRGANKPATGSAPLVAHAPENSATVGAHSALPAPVKRREAVPMPEATDELIHSLAPLQGAWLAGCQNPETGETVTGTLQVLGAEASLRWHTWGAGHPVQEGSRRLALRAPAGSQGTPAGPLDFPQGQRTEGGEFSRISDGFARLRLDAALKATLPCLDWQLASMSEDGILGRWLSPDQPVSATDLFPLEYMELQITRSPRGLSGRFASRYGLQAAHPAAARFLSAGFVPVVEFPVESPEGDFRGSFRWRNASHGEGTLWVAPLAPGVLVVRWETKGSVPASIQLTSGGALLRRR